jgi:hypothetical protein
MIETGILIALGGAFALLLGRSAVIAFWPESAAATFCETQLGFIDRVGDSDGEDGDCGADGGGGD